MRLLSIAVGFALLLATDDAEAYGRMHRRGAFGALLHQVSSAARSGDMRAMRTLVDREFTVGEELGRDSSLSLLAHDAPSRHLLAVTADHGVCYRTSSTVVQCELPGPNLDHTKLRTSIAMFEHTAHGWHLTAFYA